MLDNQLVRTKELLLCYQRFANKIDDANEYRGNGVSNYQCKEYLERLRVEITQLHNKWEKQNMAERAKWYETLG